MKIRKTTKTKTKTKDMTYLFFPFLSFFALYLFDNICREDSTLISFSFCVNKDQIVFQSQR